MARVCNFAEVKEKDMVRVADTYSPYPLMTKVSFGSALLPLLPRMDSGSSENENFWLVTFIGFGGWLYNGYSIVKWDDCEVAPGQNGLTTPRLTEVIKYHEDQRGLFWRSYAWNAGWMAAVIMTTKYNERKIAALLSLGSPFVFSLGKVWTPFQDPQTLEFSLLPLPESPTLLMTWKF